MNKKLKPLFLFGLATIFCSSCNKIEEVLPESFHHNGKPFSVELVPYEGGTITLDRGRVSDSVYSVVRLNPSDTTLRFQTGDSIILTAANKNGFTFINWKRDGVEQTIEPVYKFRLEDKDLKDGRVKYHFEARFGNDYALQVIPSIDEVIPVELIRVMGSHLHFGDNPPALFKMNVDTVLGFYAKRPTLLDYYAVDSTADFCKSYFVVDTITGQPTLPTEKSNWDYFYFHDQHRSIAKIDYKCLYVDTTFVVMGDNIDIRLLDRAHSYDSVFIMGNESNEFTAYFHQYRKRESYYTPNNYNIVVPQTPDPGSHEAVILSGRITDDGKGIENLYFGIMFLGYDDPVSAGISYANIGDIIVYHYNYLPFAYWNPNN